MNWSLWICDCKTGLNQDRVYIIAVHLSLSTHFWRISKHLVTLFFFYVQSKFHYGQSSLVSYPAWLYCVDDCCEEQALGNHWHAYKSEHQSQHSGTSKLLLLSMHMGWNKSYISDDLKDQTMWFTCKQLAIIIRSTYPHPVLCHMHTSDLGTCLGV